MDELPEVLVKHKVGLFSQESKRNFAVLTQLVVAEVLSVPGTQAELKPDEVEVDFAVFDADAATNGIVYAITVEANLYPERAGKEQEYADRIAEGLRRHFPVPLGYRGYVWVRLAPSGFTEFHT